MTRIPTTAPRQAARGLPRGRGVDAAALAELDTLIPGGATGHDQLLEHLHRLQDHFGHLPTRYLRALAQRHGDRRA